MLFKEAKKNILRHKKELSQLGVRTLALFGSIVRNEATVKSDVDVLIGFDAKRGLFGFVDVKDFLEQLLNCEVDLVTRGALHPALKRKILKEAQQVF
jgi:uncharacterized protein